MAALGPLSLPFFAISAFRLCGAVTQAVALYSLLWFGIMLFNCILDGIKEIRGRKAKNLQLKSTELCEPPSSKEIRRKLHLSQTEFSVLMGVSVRTIQDWVQGRRTPKGPARSLLRVAEQHPEVFSSIH